MLDGLEAMFATRAAHREAGLLPAANDEAALKHPAATGAAMSVLDYGLHVFPLRAGEKLPLLKAWPERASRSLIELSDWIEENPACNFGIATGKQLRYGGFLTVIDIDKPKRAGAPDGYESLRQLERAHGKLPATHSVRSAGGGLHLYFSTPSPVANSAGKLAPGIDVRGLGGYVVAPGSVVASGMYRAVPHSAAPDDVGLTEIEELPAAWVELLTKKEQRDRTQNCETEAAPGIDVVMARNRYRAMCEAASPAVEGEYGSAATLALARRGRDIGLGSADVSELMVASGWNARCIPPWDEDALSEAVDRAFRSATGEHGAEAAERLFTPVAVPPDQIAATLSGNGRRKLTPIPLRDIKLEEGSTRPLIKGLLEASALSVLYGESNSGKTFFAVDMAMHVALNRAWRNKRVNGGPVVYVAAEGGSGIRRRLLAFRQYHALDSADVPFYLLASSVDLFSVGADCSPLIEMLQAIAQDTGPVSLTVVDTLARAMAGGDENSAQDMGTFIGNLDAIRAATGSHLLVVHHSGKDRAKGARGHSSLRAAIDTEIEIADYSARVVKQRDGARDEAMAFRLQPVTIGTDEDGDAITSCIVLPAAAPTSPQRPLKVGSAASRGLLLLQRLLGEQEAIEDGGRKVVPPAVWRDAWRTESTIGRTKSDVGHESADRAFQRLRTSLLSDGYTFETQLGCGLKE